MGDVTDNPASLNAGLPLLPLRDVVVYPQIVQPLFVGRPRSIRSLEVAMHSHKQVLLVAQKNASDDDPGIKDIYAVGTIATILQLIRLPDGTVKVLVEGVTRARIRSAELVDDYFQSQVVPLHSDALPEKQGQLLLKSLLSQFDQYVQLSRKIPPEVMSSISGIDEPGRMVDTIASHM
ncbi:MAG: LON peptidase substrate-binding domain-containing protein, partial [Pseudohongiella sp.]|nr:LON peptidase substrate-binding domain-containing protein [Pseudohongiella sp.]